MCPKIKTDRSAPFRSMGKLHDEAGPDNTLCTGVSASDADLNYSAISITDLSAVIDLYREHRFAEGNCSHGPFTVSFGLPVYQAVYKKTVVGYSFYTLQDGSPSLRCYIRMGWDQQNIAGNLSLLSKGVGGNTLPPSSRELFSDASRLQEGIERLVSWLNRSV